MRVQGKILSITVIILLFVLLTGCGKKEVQTPWDVQETWNAVSAEEDFPEMIPVPENRLGYMFGIEQKDYTQEVIAVSADSLRADEIWLIEAVDEAAAQRLEELAKINRVINRELPESSIETLLVLDASTGQNAVNQAKEFMNVTNITGIILTKLDGTAKGGIIISIQK